MTSNSNHLLPQNLSEAEALVEDGALTIDEAVAWSGVGRTRLYGEMADGNLPFVQKGARRLIPRKALRRLLAEGLVSRGSDAVGRT